MTGTQGETVLLDRLQLRVGRRVVVHGVDLQLGPGVYGLLGRNGAGKTTLLRGMATALRPYAGTLSVLGVDVARASAAALRDVRRAVGYAPQLPLVLSHLTVIDQVTYAGWLKGLGVRESRRAAADALAQVHLEDRADERTGRLSGGMLRRLGIAAALVADPRVILLDEPTAGLDPEQRTSFRALVSRLGQDRIVVLSTHLVEDVVAVCGRVSILEQGRFVFDGTPQELAAHGPASPTTSTSSAIEDAFVTFTGGVRS